VKRVQHTRKAFSQTERAAVKRSSTRGKKNRTASGQKAENIPRKERVLRGWKTFWERVVAFFKNMIRTPSKKKTAKIIALVFVLVLLLLVALSSFKIASLSSIRDSIVNTFHSMLPGGGYPYQVNSSEVEKIGSIGGDLVLLEKGRTVTLSGTAKETAEKEHTYANPAMSLNDRKVICYNRSGHRYRVETRTDVVYEGKTEEDEPIITAAIGKKGNIALATLSDKAMSRLTVLSKNYKQTEFVWNCAEYTITSVSLSDNGRYVAVSAIGSKDGEIFSKVYVFDFAYTDPVCAFEYPGTAMISVHFSSNNDVVAIGDNKIAFLKNLKKNEETELSTSTVSAFCYSPSGDTIVVLAEYGSLNSQILRCYTAGGKISFEQKYAEPIKSVTASSGRITVLCNAHVDSYGMGGHKYKSYKANADTVTALRVGNRTYLYESGQIAKAKGKYKGTEGT